MGDDKEVPDVSDVIRTDEERIRDYLDRIVRGMVEASLNAMLDPEMDRLCNAAR